MDELALVIEQVRALDGASFRGGVSRHFIEVIETNGEVRMDLMSDAWDDMSVNSDALRHSRSGRKSPVTFM